MLTLEVRFVPTKDNYIQMPGQKFALSSPHSFFQKTLVSEKVSSFPFSLLLSAFTIFLRTFQIIFFAYLTREWFFSSLYLRNFARENWRTAGKS